MGFFDLFTKSAAQPIDAIGYALDGLFTSDEERAQADAVMAKLRQHPDELQVELNKVEAGHRSVFVAGWRPAVGWVCALALLYSFIVRDILAWVMAIWWPDVAPPPELAMEHLLTVLMGMLGLGAMRTVEKFGGKTK